MAFTMEFLEDLFPSIVGNQEKLELIKQVVTDSREEQTESLFVPIIGERFDGHEFLPEAVRNGAIATLWQKDKPKPQEVHGDFVYIEVVDTVEALQSLAKAYRERINPKVIGITGSNGKTTTKDLLHAVLKQMYETHATVGNFNNEIGLPLTILQMEENTEMLVLEMGMDAFGEIELLSNIAQPDYAIITNIGESHIEFLGSREGIAQAKMEIIAGLDINGMLIVDGDEPLLEQPPYRGEIMACGFSHKVDMRLGDVDVEVDQTRFTVDGDQPFSIPLAGKHHAKNASYVIALAEKLGITNDTIQVGLNKLAHSSMRFEKIYGKNDVLLINDAYNASITSMIGAIDIIKSLKNYRKKIVVLGDVLELGDTARELHRSIASAINGEIDAVYTLGDFAGEITDVLKIEQPFIDSAHFTDKEQIETRLQPHLAPDTVILFKASRMMQLELLVEACK